MTTIAKPGLEVDVIEVPATAIVCGASDCDKPATEMFHHSACGGANPSCTHHAVEGREFLLRTFVRGKTPVHIDCDSRITPTNHSFRAI